MKKAIFLALTIVVFSLPFAAWAQEKETKPSDETQVNKVIRLRYADPPVVRTLLARLGFMEEAKVMDDKAGIIIIRGSKSHVEAVEDILKQMDMPSPPAKSIELTAYLLTATRQPSPSSGLPSTLNEAVNELKKVLNYQGFSLANSALMRTMDGQGDGMIYGAADPSDPSKLFRLACHRIAVTTQEKHTTVHINGLDFQIRTEPHKVTAGGGPTTGTVTYDVGATVDAEIHTDIDIPVGQTVVVGKTSFGSPDSALVLVLTAKVLD